jgi:light-regulated signal transduction histidine kinase (bacteriophytochrome)
MTTDKKITIQNCEDELIHIPGSIQAHGYLIVVEPSALVISHVSENIDGLLGVTAEDVVGTKLSDWINQDFSAHLEQECATGLRSHYEPQSVLVNAQHSSHELNAVVTTNQSQISIALEPAVVADNQQHPSILNVMKGALAGLMGIEDLQSIFDTAVNEVKVLSGFDRVMLYEFDHEYNGQVIAEAKESHLNSFFMQHFPESDIPKQARDMYLKTPVRLLVNANAPVSPIFPSTPHVDMTLCSLRSVSPIHIQYLKNMGVTATLTISIIVKNKLWGLIACHHYDEKFISSELRDITQYISVMLSQLVSVKLESQAAKQKSSAFTSLNALSQNLTQALQLSDLELNGKDLLELVGATGVVAKIQGKYRFFGEVPSQEAVHSLYQIICEHHLKDQDYFSSFQLSKDVPSFTEGDKASGVLAINFASDFESDFILWFRKEVIELKNWGGKPEKRLEFWDDGTHRLMPRSSFALWKQTVKDKSAPWSEEEIDAASRLRVLILSKLVAETENVKRLNKQLEELVDQRTYALTQEIKQKEEVQQSLSIALKESEASNRELERFAFVASHDLQEPLRKIQTFGDRLQHSIDPVSDKNALYIERMRTSATRMQSLIKDTLNYSRLSNQAPEKQLFDADVAFRTVLSDLSVSIKDKKASVDLQPIGQLLGDSGQLRRVVQNLISNALKFTPANRTPSVVIRLFETSSEYKVIEIADNGIGIEEQYAKKVFDLFARLHAKSEYPGTGMGLTICKKVIQNHGGDIWLVSEPNQGSKFYIKLPFKAAVN